MFITSATCDLTPEQRAAQPHAGALFVCRPGVTGLPTTPFAGLEAVDEVHEFQSARVSPI